MECTFALPVSFSSHYDVIVMSSLCSIVHIHVCTKIEVHSVLPLLHLDPEVRMYVMYVIMHTVHLLC